MSFNCLLGFGRFIRENRGGALVWQISCNKVEMKGD